MTIEELVTHIRKISRTELDVWTGCGIGEIEYIDRYKQLRVVFGHFEEQDIDYELLLDEVLFFMKVDEPIFEGDIEPEIPLDPFINVYKDSKVLSFVKDQFMLNDESGTLLHYQLTGQNMFLNIISRGLPVINRIEEEVVYEFLIDEVFSFFKMDESVRPGSDLEPERPLQYPFVNMYRDSKVLNFLKKQLLINEVYPMPEILALSANSSEYDF